MSYTLWLYLHIIFMCRGHLICIYTQIYNMYFYSYTLVLRIPPVGCLDKMIIWKSKDPRRSGLFFREVFFAFPKAKMKIRLARLFCRSWKELRPFIGSKSLITTKICKSSLYCTYTIHMSNEFEASILFAQNMSQICSCITLILGCCSSLRTNASSNHPTLHRVPTISGSSSFCSVHAGYNPVNSSQHPADLAYTMEVFPETNTALATQPSVSNGELLFEALIFRCNTIVREVFGGVICHFYFLKLMIKSTLWILIPCQGSKILLFLNSFWHMWGGFYLWLRRSWWCCSTWALSCVKLQHDLNISYTPED